MSRRHIALSGFIAVVMLLLGWQLGVRYEQMRYESSQDDLNTSYTGGTGSGEVITNPEEQVDITLLWNVWQLLSSRYIHAADLKTQTLLYGAVTGLVDSVGDPYTVFMTPTENTDFRQSLSGHLQGIGAELALRDGKIVVVSPLKGSPAEKAGLMAEDVITEVDGASMEGKTLQDAVMVIRGEKDTKVTLTIDRKDSAQPVVLTIVRDDIEVPSATYEVKKSGSGSIGYLTLYQFGAETVKEAEAELQKVKTEPVDAILIDLRGNGGGYLDGAVALSSLFMKEGKVVSVERSSGAPTVHNVSGKPLLPDIPMAVLINQGSASASEIVAGALQDQKRAKIIGMTSFGKGTVQEVIDLPGGSSLRVTTARWLTPSGRDLGKHGVTPDIEVDLTKADVDAGHDPQMDAAIEWLLDHEDVTGGRRISASGSTL